MKRSKIVPFIIALLVAGSVSAYAAGRQDPMGLAKQSYVAGVEGLATVLYPKRAEGVQKKAVAIGKKVAVLTPDNRVIYEGEMERLSGEGALFLNEAAQSLDAANEGDAFTVADAIAAAVSDSGVTPAKTASASKTAAPAKTTATDKNATADKNAAPDKTTATDKSAPTNKGAVAAGLTGKTAAAFSALDSGNYHMKTKTMVEGMEVISEIYVKGGMMATVSEIMGMSFRNVHRDNKVHLINDMMKTVTITSTKDNTSQEPVKTAGLVMTGSGTASFNGKNLPYEEYRLEDSKNDIKTQFFLDGRNPAGIRTITGKTVIDMVILVLDQKVPNNIFDIPAGYQKIEM